MFIPLHDSNALDKIRLQYVTLIIIAANILIWTMTTTTEFVATQQANVINYTYGFIPDAIDGSVIFPPIIDRPPEYFTYISYSFLHAGFFHLAGNMLFLWVFGDNVEDAMGHFRFIIFYLVCTVIAAFAHWAMDPSSQIPLIGASGAAAGIVGAYLMLHPKVKVWILVLGRIPIKLSARWVIGFWILYQIYSLITDTTGQVSWAAHVGGFFAGALLIMVFKRSDVALFDRDLKLAERSVPTQTAEAKNPTKTAHRWGRD